MKSPSTMACIHSSAPGHKHGTHNGMKAQDWLAAAGLNDLSLDNDELSKTSSTGDTVNLQDLRDPLQVDILQEDELSPSSAPKAPDPPIPKVMGTSGHDNLEVLDMTPVATPQTTTPLAPIDGPSQGTDTATLFGNTHSTGSKFPENMVEDTNDDDDLDKFPLLQAHAQRKKSKSE